MTTRWILDETQVNPDTGTPGRLVPAEDYVPTNARLSGGPVSDLYMDGVRATDGTDIGSRKKRREYMRAHQLVDADDCKGLWQQAEKRREGIQDGSGDTQARREAVAAALRKARR